MSIRALAVALPLLAACGGVGEGDHALGAARAPIQGGIGAPGESAIVGVTSNQAGSGLCTGSLIAPNVVLTARHCVSGFFGDTGGSFHCQTRANEPWSVEGFRITTRDVAFFAPRSVREVVVLPGEDALLCGRDLAALILDEPVPPAEVTPLLPRVDADVAKGERYDAVGYGGVDDEGTGAGIRRRLDGLVVECVGEACPPGDLVATTEWRGERGLCPGDSGGPALDASERVVGVTSRGRAGCVEPIYGHVAAWADWLKAVAEHGAEVGGYEAPAWAHGHPTDPKFNWPVGAECRAADQCASTQCLVADRVSYCTRNCTPEASCPAGYTCDADLSLCRRLPSPPRVEPAGGCAHEGREAPGAGWWVVAAGAAYGSRRRSSRRC